MKENKRTAMPLLASAVLLCMCWLFPTVGSGQVCGEGVGVPPFLSSGSSANLMMVLDNSGSMLDLAYVNAATQCFDETYTSSKTYAGYFEENAWYTWESDGEKWDSAATGSDSWVAHWKLAKTYAAGDIVYANGGLYKATRQGFSGDSNPNDGLNISDDTASTSPGWIPVSSQAATVTSLATPCADDALVAYNNSVYICKSNQWTRLEGGQFVKIDPVAYPDPENDYCDTVSLGVKYTLDGELCTKVDESSVNGVQQAMNIFVARGNLLNWAMTSKFDIQKKILSGGKYVEDNTGKGQLVGESRGCSGYGFVKQVPVSEIVNGTAVAASKLVMRVRGANNDDRVGNLPKNENSDDTTRLEIIGLTATGFDQGLCQDVIKLLEDAAAGKPVTGDLKKLTEQCVAGGNIVGNAQKVHIDTLNICANLWNQRLLYPQPTDLNGFGRAVNSLTASCEALYNTGYSPASMSPQDGGYACYGIYDDKLDHRDRVGYLGRCWDAGGTTSGTGGTTDTCGPKAEVAAAQGGCNRGGAVYCTYCDDGSSPNCTNSNIYKNEGGYNYKCIDTKGNNNNGYYCAKNDDPGDWVLLYADSSGVPCTPSVSSGGTTTTTGGWTPSWSSSSKADDLEMACISWGIIDYCGDYKVAEVIDPSDSASNTNEFYNAPAILIDGGVLGQMGIAKPLIVFKDLIDYQLPDEQLTDDVSQPNGPRGIIYEFASDLRMGVMAFENNGARTECNALAVTCTDNDANEIPDVCETAQGGNPTNPDCIFCKQRENVVKYCPAGNGDGAKVLQSIDFGMYNDGTADNWTHYKDLVASINGTRATAWTPLAEAMFTAIGYYTQNEDFCLEKNSTTGACESFNISATDDPIQHWCQSNHVLIITEGASTADINKKVSDFTVNSDKSAYFTGYDTLTNSGSCNGINTGARCVNSKGIDIVDDVTGDNAVDNDVDGSTAVVNAADSACIDTGLDGSTYLDDMTWWARNVLPLYAHRKIKTSDDIWEDKQNITTHIVTTGSLRDDGTTTECNPKELMSRAAFNGGTDTYYPGENPQQLEASLRAVFNDILSRSSSGSAASVISNSRSGSGAVYQAVFWPKSEDTDPDGDGVSHKVSWVGDVHALFMSQDGLMYEDTNQDAKLDTAVDKRVILYYSDNVGRTRGCYQSLNALGVCPDDADYVEDTTCPAGGGLSGLGCVELLDVKYLWSADKQLRDMEMRSPSVERKIFTWNDADNDGIVDRDAQNNEWFELKSGVDWAALNATAASTAKTGATSPWPRGPVTRDFLSPEDWSTFVSDDGSGTTDGPLKELVADNNFPPDPLGLDALNSLIDWLHGHDHLNNQTTSVDGRLDKILRSRTFSFSDTSGTVIDAEWKLGDVIHSTPTVVNKPAEVYHYIYRDPTYKKFADRWADRRSVIYFGANDGMLHAVNGGFYQESTGQFCCRFEPAFDAATGQENSNAGTCIEPVNGVCADDRPLGDELWAYIPYNLQPHLKCLADPSYRHKYYVDQKPRIFDVQIFTEESACRSDINGTTGPGTLKYQQDCVHAGGWGTILVGGMGFGGAPIQADSLNGMTADTREFSSSFFILDITNPEADPVLLGEMTRPTNQHVDLNYTTSTPAMVIMRGDDPALGGLHSSWYLVMGSGPSEEDGRNISEGKLAVFPLNRLTGAATQWTDGVPTTITWNSEKSFRILDQKPGNADDTNITTEAGVFRVPGAGPAYISDMISVDYDVELSSSDTLGSRYRSDAIYFGTTDGEKFAKYPEKYLEAYPDDYYYWSKGGRLFRLVTKVLDSNGKDVYSKPSEWAGQWTTPSTSDPSPVRMLVDAKMPIVAGPAIGFDGSNFWVYVGTGHFYDEKDKTDDGWCTEAVDTNCLNGDTNSKISFFGIREPVKDAQSNFTDWKTPPSSNITCENNVLTWGAISENNAGTLTPWDINEQTNQNLAHNGVPGQRGLIQTDNILVQTGTGYLDCSDCKTGDNGVYTCTTQKEKVCFPDTDDDDTTKEGPLYDDSEKQYTFSKLKNYIAGTGCDAGKSTGIDGWYRDFSDPRERNLGTAALLGGLVTYTSYQPFSDKCKSEGQGFLYAVHFQTGTAWTKSVFGTFDSDGTLHKDGSGIFVKDKMSTGQGMSTTPSMHVGAGSKGASAFVQTSTGEIVEIKQENLPLNNTKSGRINWNDRCSQ